MIDEKKCYLFGRNPDLNDFVIDHQSCSRVHAALVYHKHLQRAFLVDLGSTHGTFIGTIRLEQHKPTQLPVDSKFHFGASTRLYILRERPQKVAARQGDDSTVTEEVEGGLLGLPETETELDNLTEYNTAHNRRITMLGIPDEELKPPNRKQKNLSVKFNEEEDVINPEDVDPSIGRFRNLVHTAVIPKKEGKDGHWRPTEHPAARLGQVEPHAPLLKARIHARLSPKYHLLADALGQAWTSPAKSCARDRAGRCPSREPCRASGNSAPSRCGCQPPSGTQEEEVCQGGMARKKASALFTHVKVEVVTWNHWPQFQCGEENSSARGFNCRKGAGPSMWQMCAGCDKCLYMFVHCYAFWSADTRNDRRQQQNCGTETRGSYCLQVERQCAVSRLVCSCDWHCHVAVKQL
uniref:Nuclear inhibitor of protein phosphatase 1 n=1 Tax=Rhipicephalus zambeziensis TaxID=60191 RepID=A0A224YUT8_9ACAR